MGLNPQSEAPYSPSAAVEQWSEPAPTEARLEDGLRTNAQKHALPGARGRGTIDADL